MYSLLDDICYVRGPFRQEFVNCRRLLVTTAGEAAHFYYRSLNLASMSDIKQPFYKSKAFWTLVSSIVAALAAFFLSSCSAQARMQRSGVHIDTVRVDYIIRSRNLTHM